VQGSLAPATAAGTLARLVPAFSGLFAPHWKSDARGVIAGLTAYANRGHLARAVLEATAYQTRDVLAAMEQDCDILDATVVRPRVTETTALGAAYAAGLAVDYWKGRDDLVANWQVEKRWTPRMRPEERARLYGRWQKAVARSLAWID
jgi:glycerol kinase